MTATALTAAAKQIAKLHAAEAVQAAQSEPVKFAGQLCRANLRCAQCHLLHLQESLMADKMHVLPVE